MTEQLSDQQQQWPTFKKLFLLFTIAYLFLYMFPFPLDQFPMLYYLADFYMQALDAINLWVGKSLPGMESLQKIEFTGSGDTTFDYVRLLTNTLLSLVLALIIFILTRKHANYSWLYRTTINYARYYVGLYMILYGFAKLFEGQFRFPGFGLLEQSYGDSSPMRLLWTFMGYSRSYSVFSGLGEVVAGYLLLFRRTTVLGCLVTIIIMLNVVMLNFSYDVPVKIFSSHLVLISFIILTPDIKRLLHFFILNRPAEISPAQLVLPKRWMRISRLVFKSVFVVGAPILVMFILLQEEEVPNRLAGSYKAEVFQLGQSTLPPLTTDTVRWKKMIIDENYVKIITMVDSAVYYQHEIDTLKHTIRLSSEKDTTQKYLLAYKAEPDNGFSISGVYKSDSISVSFKKKTLQDYKLVNRGFHWINEYPYNR